MHDTRRISPRGARSAKRRPRRARVCAVHHAIGLLLVPWRVWARLIAEGERSASRAKREAHGKIESPGSHVGCSVTTRGLEGCSWERTISPPSTNLARPRSGERDRDHSTPWG